MARYNGKITHKDNSELAVTCAHSPIMILMGTENTIRFVMIELKAVEVELALLMCLRSTIFCQSK